MCIGLRAVSIAYVGGNLTINLGNSVVLDLSGSNSFTSYQGYIKAKMM